jgi:iron complex transport system permease protein
MLAVYHLAQVGGRLPVETFLLAGVVVGSFLWAFVSFILTLARSRMQEVVFWLMGDLSSADYSQVVTVAPYLVVGAATLFLLSHTLNLLTLGEESAFHLGVPVEAIKVLIVAVASLLTAAAVSVSGLIGFVGLMVPHLTRAVTGPDHRLLLPASALAGGAFLLLADTLARSVAVDQEIPVGVITALLGGPFFFALLRRRRHVH